jgi:hypothetical protein
MTNTSDPNGVRSKSTSKFNAALDCAVLYYLTGDTKYAQLAADVLHNVVKTLLPVTPSTDTGNGGWIIRNDLLLEARVLGTQLPVVYDFIRTFLESNKVHDVMAGGLTDFNYYKAQQYFRTYYQLVCDHGNNTNNWSALESTCMLNNLLALADPTERATALNIYLVPGTSKQSSLKEDYSEYPKPDSIWPESLQYAGAVGSIRSTHMVLLERYDPSKSASATVGARPKESRISTTNSSTSTPRRSGARISSLSSVRPSSAGWMRANTTARRCAPMRTWICTTNRSSSSGSPPRSLKPASPRS